MTHTIQPGSRTGRVNIISSKSCAHRLIILAALAKSASTITCRGTSADIEATIDCVTALGVRVTRNGDTISVEPIHKVPDGLCELHCRESGSTLRFLLPIVGVLGAKAVFIMEGRLGERPLKPLDQVLTAHGMNISKDGNRLYCSGSLTPSEYSIDGGVSSQYISGLLMALPLLYSKSTLDITGRLESAAYIDITLNALSLAGAVPGCSSDRRHYDIAGKSEYNLGTCSAEGDWSNAAFFLCMGALSKLGITVCNLNPASCQGDRKICEILSEMGADVQIRANEVSVKRRELKPIEIDASPIPDLIPALCALAANAIGDTRIINAQRLRLKESDRIKSTLNMLMSLGVNAEETPDGLIIHGTGKVRGGTVDAYNDHRIAMAAAVAASNASESVIIEGSECVKKSYPAFFETLETLAAEGENT